MSRHAINPFFVPLVSLFVFSIAFFYPTESWEAIFGETNHAHLDIKALVFILSCLLMYYLGLTITLHLSPPKGNSYSRAGRVNIGWLLTPVLGATSLVLIAYLAYLNAHMPGYIFLSITGHGDQVKQLIADDQIQFNTIANYAIPVVWWAWYRYYSHTEHATTTGLSLVFVRLMLVATTALLVATMIINVARFAIMPLFIGLFLIYAHLKVYQRKPPTRHLGASIKLALYLSLGLLLLFSLFAIARGSTGVEQLVEMILGYGPVSFNRLSAVLNGDLTYQYSTTGAYLIPEPLIQGMSHLLGSDYPSAVTVWLSEFDGVRNAGLNEKFIWLTVFGYLYDSIGLMSLPWFTLIGAMSAILWRAFCGGAVFGIVFYPLIYFTLLFIFGSNYLVIFAPYYFLSFVFLFLWEFILTRNLINNQERHNG